MPEFELKEVYSLYTDCWKLYRKYHTANTDEEWQQLTAEAQDLVKKHGNYSRHLVTDTICLIEWRNQHGAIHG